MGVDAKMFVRIQGQENWLKPEDETRAAYELASTVGYSHFMISKGSDYAFGDAHHALKIMTPIKDAEAAEYHGLSPEMIGHIVWTQDGDDIVAAADEQFIRIYLYMRYYGEEYARGDWPILRAIAEWCEYRFPAGEVWYGGDSSGICAEHLTATRREELTRFYLGSGRKSYVRYDRGYLSPFGGSDAHPTCTVCEVGMIDCGGSRDYTFWHCDGCGQKVVAHADGRRFTGSAP